MNFNYVLLVVAIFAIIVGLFLTLNSLFLKKNEINEQASSLQLEIDRLISELEQVRSQLDQALTENQHLKTYYKQHQVVNQENNKLALAAKAVQDEVSLWSSLSHPLGCDFLLQKNIFLL